jgi:RND family efflux transporter MFP subunit
MSSEVQNTDLSALRIKNRPQQTEKNSSGHTRLRLYIGIAGVLLVLALILIYTSGASSQEPVDIATVSMTSPGQAGAVLTASGYVVADIKAAVASKGTGRLEYLGVEEGDYVKKGNIIGRIESSDVEAALGQAKANVAVARATVDQAKAELDDATSNFERQKSLMEQKLISQAEFDIANARYRRAVALLSSAKASVQSAEAGVRSAEVGVENTLIRAPFDGVVLTKSANVGEVMTPFGAAAGSRGALVTMADMSSLEVEADVSESNIE